ncbi:MAG: tRNA pseudouridine(13) synthase TruD, partial [Chloroflexota bacterium]
MLELAEYNELPYITTNILGCGGMLRAKPEHFIVEEIPLYLPEDDGQHLYVNLTKVNQTTKDIQKQLARLFKVQESH